MAWAIIMSDGLPTELKPPPMLALIERMARDPAVDVDKLQSLLNMQQQIEDREEELVRLRRETVQLKKEREDIRGRVEKMLAQIESMAEAS